MGCRGGVPHMGGMQQMPVQFSALLIQKFPQMMHVGLGMGQVGFVPAEQMTHQYQFLMSNVKCQKDTMLPDL